MKKFLFSLLILCMLVFNACSTNKPLQMIQEVQIESTTAERSTIMGSGRRMPFAMAIAESATDLVIAQYVGRRPFGENLTEYEFVVLERVIGNAANRIFVYTDARIEGIFFFNSGVDYLLPLTRITSPYATTHDDGYRFISFAINLDDPSSSIVNNSILLQHAEEYGLDIMGITRQEVVSHVTGLISPQIVSLAVNELINTEVIEDIIIGSPYVLVVEIGRPSRLVSQLYTSDWSYDDIYFATVVNVLESYGDIIIGDEIEVIFHANTVFTGEQHIVATRQSSTGRHNFTSRNSLFSVDQLDEIIQILNTPVPLDLSGFPPITNISAHTGRSFTVQVTTSPNIEFAVSIEADDPHNEANPAQQWITVDTITQPNQSGVGSFRVVVAPNQSFDGRMGTITVTAPNATPQTITLPQGGIPVYLDVFPQAITLQPTGGNTTIGVWSNNTWQINSTVPWLSVYSAYPLNQTGWGNFVLHAEPNTGSAPRLGQVILSSRDVTTLIHLTQGVATQSFQLSANGIQITEWNPTHLSELVNIDVTSNRSWTINIPEHAHGWLSYSNITGQTGNGSFRLNTTVNNNNTSRQARVTVTAGTDTRHIDVTQAAYQTIPQLAVVFHFDGQTMELSLTNGHINTSQVPTPATRYGQPGIPGQAFMGWFTELFEGMHFVHNQNRAVPFNLSQAITWGMTDANGRLHLHASWSHFGDVNGDGIIDTLDMLQLADVISGRIPVSHLNFRPSDVNVDGRVDPVDRSLLLMHVLGAPGVILGPHNPNIVPGSYLLSFNFGRQVIDIPIANGGIDTALITEAELLDWEMELLNVLYDAYQQGERTAGFAVYVTALDSATSYVMELDLSAMGAVTAEVISEMRASYAVMAGAFVLDSSVEGN